MTEPKRYQCRHIFTDGHRCGSPCLRHEDFCYYHHTTCRPVQDPRQRPARTALFDLPMPEDRAAIQLSIGEVLRRIARNEIDPRRAGLLLYGLQIASTNLPRQTKPSRNTRDEAPSTSIEDITTDPEQGLLAPQSEYDQDTAAGRPKSIMRQLFDQFAQDKPTQEPTPEPKPAIPPTLQATAENPPTSAQISVKPFRLPSAPLRVNPRSTPRVRPLQPVKKTPETVKSTYGNLAYRRDVLRADLRLRWDAGRQCSRASSLDPAGAQAAWPYHDRRLVPPETRTRS